ncbi:pro-opiomelanocortin-1-like [Myxocyprinus asiaticus]|uniref:pro-opiomelanocortin-1-like n=1 Tax=Myxocyprinus asiaticus TaxID=70543 RepID=UPI0022229209|nr:pro-opiomelanocortin-1-like [Myxocyprinus asiaticus]
MMCPAWFLALAVLCAGGSEVRGQCWENTRCRDLSTEENILDCIQLCKSDLTDETPVYPGENHLQPPSEPEQNEVLAPLSTIAFVPTAEQMAPESSTRHEHKRSYSMEHFRWGKPVGRKRRPIKVYTNGVEEESAETLPAEMRRELATNDIDYPLEENTLSQQEKKDGSYKMNHFRWGGPPASKRYGGFMKSWDERSQKPLLTLFKNVINKDHQKKDQ